MTRTTTARKSANAAPATDPATLLMAALQAAAAAQGPTKRATTQARAEILSQPLTARDQAAIDRIGWTGARLSSPKPAAPKPTAKVKSGPIVNPATFATLTPERQASTQFWAGLCSTLARSNGRIWLPEIAAVAAQLNVELASPAQLSARLSALTGLTVNRPTADAGWLVCEITEPMPGADIWAQLWNAHLQTFTDAVAADS